MESSSPPCRRRPCPLIQLCAIAILVIAMHVEARAADAASTDQAYPPGWSISFLQEPEFDSRMFVLEAGDPDDPAVLLVHGLGEVASDDWRGTIAALQDDYHVIAPDLPGFGRSDVPQGPLTPARYARALRWLVRSLELESVRLVGHSMGGAIALYYASEYPEDLEHLVVVDSAGVLHRAAFARTVLRPRIDLHALPDGMEITLLRLLNSGERLVEQFLSSSAAAEQLRRWSAQWKAMLSDRPNENAAIGLIDTDYSGRLEQVKVPGTLIWGGADPVTPLRIGHLVHGLLPQSRLHVIDGAQHVPMKSHPESFLGFLRPALKGGEPPVRATATGAETNAGEYRCTGEAGVYLSGHYDSILIESCVNVRMEDVQANRVVIRDSLVEMLRVTVTTRSGGAAVEVHDSAIRATDISVQGEPALHVNAGRLDVAGASLRSGDAAVVVERGSSFIFSVSRLQSGLYDGYLHGMEVVEQRTLDTVEAFHSDNGIRERL